MKHIQTKHAKAQTHAHVCAHSPTYKHAYTLLPSFGMLLTTAVSQNIVFVKPNNYACESKDVIVYT